VKWGFLEVIFEGFYGLIFGEFYRTIHSVMPCRGGWASPEMVTQSPEMVTHGWVTTKTKPNPNKPKQNLNFKSKRPNKINK
jgi:hypothetical protein